MSGTHHTNYVKIWAILLALLVVSVAGPFLGITIVTLITAFGIAGIKAYLVCKHFMHLDVEKPIIKWLLATCLVLMALFFFGTAPDVLRHDGTNWENTAAKAAVERGIEEPHHEAPAETPGAAETHDAVDTHEAVEAVAGVDEAPAAFDPATAYATSCSACHGVAGAGDGAAAVALQPPPANFVDPAFWETRTDEQVFTAIRDGGPAVGGSPLMAPWAASFSDEQITALVEHLKTFGGQDG
ncbi:MAG TPA: c-type cytochrome [Myxococcota bacterium]|nr:c-type cytochrome [Myxococcota bacterium]